MHSPEELIESFAREIERDSPVEAAVIRRCGVAEEVTAIVAQCDIHGTPQEVEDAFKRIVRWYGRTKLNQHALTYIMDHEVWLAGFRDDSEIPDIRYHTLDELREMPYREYLLTEDWQNVRWHALKRANHRCQICYADQDLQVHHRTYERRGEELPEDVTVLCAKCHSTFHDVKTGKPRRMPVKAGR